MSRFTNNDDELGFDEVEAVGLDGTGFDGDPRFPYHWSNLTDAERAGVEAYRARYETEEK